MTAGDSGTLTRVPKSEVYAVIESDLTSAISALPAQKSTDGRATSFTAHALLGKVYLYQGKYSEAANILEPLIGLYTLPSNPSNFNESGIEHDDVILTILICLFKKIAETLLSNPTLFSV